jgi:hypothetical protein
MPEDPLEKQRRYYAQIAVSYDSTFAFDSEDEHFIACSLLTRSKGYHDTECDVVF